MSDYAAQNSVGWRVRWGPQELNMTLLVDLEDSKRWKLVYADSDPVFKLNLEGKFVAEEPVPIYEKIIELPEVAVVPRILECCFKDHITGVPAPRRKNKEPYIDRNVAANLEKSFYERLLCGYLDSHQVFAVEHSGVLLANRLGVRLDGRILVSHYAVSTFQDDGGINVTVEGSINDNRPILIIDDMLSSGRTADAILTYLEEQHPELRVRYVTLFDIVASREVPEVESSVETFQPISNHYWIYGRGMDLLSQESRLCADIYGADKGFGWETTGDVDELRNFFNK